MHSFPLCREDFMVGFLLAAYVAAAVCATGASGDPKPVDTSALVDDESFAALLSLSVLWQQLLPAETLLWQMQPLAAWTSRVGLQISCR